MVYSPKGSHFRGRNTFKLILIFIEILIGKFKSSYEVYLLTLYLGVLIVDLPFY